MPKNLGESLRAIWRANEGHQSAMAHYRLRGCDHVIGSWGQIVREFEGNFKEFKGNLKEFEGNLKEFEGNLKEFEGNLKEFEGNLKEFKGKLKEFEGNLKEFECNLKEFKAIWGQLESIRELKEIWPQTPWIQRGNCYPLPKSLRTQM